MKRIVCRILPFPQKAPKRMGIRGPSISVSHLRRSPQSVQPTQGFRAWAKLFRASGAGLWRGEALQNKARIFPISISRGISRLRPDTEPAILVCGSSLVQDESLERIP
jgi:hypothetical protein